MTNCGSCKQWLGLLEREPDPDALDYYCPVADKRVYLHHPRCEHFEEVRTPKEEAARRSRIAQAFNSMGPDDQVPK